MMRWLATAALLLLPAVAAAGSFPAASDCAALAAADPVSAYSQLAELAPSELSRLDGQAFVALVEDNVADRWDVALLPQGRRRLTYRMGRNHVTEGWNWHPEAESSRDDYYRHKYLPLGERETEIATARFESDPAVGGYMVRFVRRDAYYLSFDNPYDFYTRNDEDDGFTIETPLPVTMFFLIARGRFVAPHRSESTTYWRAEPLRKVDLTLKNRYFMARLEALWFCDGDGRILGKLGR